MNADQRNNLEMLVEALATSLYGAWSYAQVLRGFYNGAKAVPEVLNEHAHVTTEIWRALFDALFALIGTIIDRTPNTESLPSLLAMLTRYTPDDPRMRLLQRDLLKRLESNKVPGLRKLEAWRMKAVAHRTPEGKLPSFYTSNQMHLDEIVESLRYLEEILNDFARSVLGTMHIIEPDTDHLAIRSEEFLVRFVGRAITNGRPFFRRDSPLHK